MEESRGEEEFLVVETDEARLAKLRGGALTCQEYLLSHPRGWLVRCEAGAVTARALELARLPRFYLPSAGEFFDLEGPRPPLPGPS